MSVLLNYRGSGAGDVYDQYHSVVSREFHDGELGLGPDPVINVTLEKVIDYPIIVAKLRARNKVSYRRRLSHIRRNKTDFQTAWLIRRGGVRVVQANGTIVTGERSAAMYDSTAPFFVELMMDAQGFHESLMLFIPRHVFRTKVGSMSNFNLSFPLTSGPGLVAEQALTLICDHGASVSRATLEPLANCALGGLASCMAAKVPPPLSISERRGADIERYIMQNLGDPDLSATAVAKACNVSIRYLHYILKSGGHMFSTLVWSARLEKARDWIRSADMGDRPVGEIGQMCGYKSVSHFRRQFRARYGLSPKQYREQHLAGARGADGAVRPGRPLDS